MNEIKSVEYIAAELEAVAEWISADTGQSEDRHSLRAAATLLREMKQELIEDEGVIKVLRRQRNKAEKALDKLTETR